MIHAITQLWDTLWAFFLHATGSDNPSGVEYGFWSGWGSDIPIFVALLGFGKLHANCHEPGCLRLAKHHYTDEDGLTHLLCLKHHPTHPGRGVSIAQHCADDHERRSSASEPEHLFGL
jgi:hypothetical protein